MKKKIILVSGDPNSINSEIIFKSWKKLSKKTKKNLFLISNCNLLKKQFKKLNYKIQIIPVKNISETNNLNKLKVIDTNLNFVDPFKVSKKSSSKFVMESLKKAHKLSLNKNVVGLINCPIDKKLLDKKETGVTELLASYCKVKKNSEVMIIMNNKLIVSPITTHLDIKSVSKNINKKIIINKVKTINNWYKRSFKRKPKIGILGLNPHNSELRTNSEEKKVIIPAINKIKKLGINVKGPLVSDTLFIQNYKNFNVIVGMYHDQVLSPFKTLYKFKAINLTLGLKYIRVSPDHGVAADKILQKKSNPESLLDCIKFIDNFNK